MKRALLVAAVVALPAAWSIVLSCHSPAAPQAAPRATDTSGDVDGQRDRDRDRAHLGLVMTSRFCGSCHPDIWAEHAQNTHGRAFTDEEVRLATGRFDHGDCIRCHTPRPVFETGIGMNPIRRFHDLEEGNTCMTCHWRQDYDYARFHGGAECKVAFDPRVGTIEACASCHRNHGTPYQWELAPNGKAKGRRCISCHMREVVRPVAVGEEPRPVRSHLFPGSRDEKHLRRAYDWEAKVDGNEVVVRVTNSGAGHNFPTELKQRSVESLIVVRDASGVEVARSRMVFRDPYKRPYGLHLPVNTQIPSGETREHRVPLKVAAGSVDCELHYKLYFPIEDHHPDLARQLEARTLVFDGITPSEKDVVSEPEVKVTTPEGIAPETAGPADLVDYARPKIAKVEIDVPAGSGEADIRALIDLFQFPVPEGNRRAQARLAEIGAPAVPALVAAMGSWDNKTWTQAVAVLGRLGEVAVPAVQDALRSDQLYVRFHARALAPRLAWGERRDAVVEALREALAAQHALDRQSAAEALGALGARDAAPALRPLLDDLDPDVVRAAALSLAQLDDREAAAPMERALRAAPYTETRRDLAEALAALGSPAGIPELIAQLDHSDDLLREDAFESLFAVTGVHLGYDPFAPRDERLAAIARLQVHWAENGGPDALRRRPLLPDAKTHAHAWHLVAQLGGGDGTMPGGDDAELTEELVALGEDAVPALVLGLKFPPGFADKRAKLCECLGRIASRDAAPALAATLRDPVLAVAAWACWALEGVNDKDTLPALQRYQDRLLSLSSAGRIPEGLGPADRLLAQAARVRLLVGDDRAQHDLARLLLSADDAARRAAIEALERKFGERRGYDADTDEGERRAAAGRW